MQHKHGMRIAIVALAGLLALPAQAQSFSCRIGTQPACLDYGDNVCSSAGKCVDSSSACFDSYQCNYEGFTCKSNVTDCAQEHDRLAGAYNTLLKTNNDLVDQYNGLLSDYDTLLSKAKKLAEKHDALNDCLLHASAMDDVQTCLIYQ